MILVCLGDVSFLLSESCISLGKNGPSCFLPLKHTVAHKSIQDAEARPKVQDLSQKPEWWGFLHVVRLWHFLDTSFRVHMLTPWSLRKLVITLIKLWFCLLCWVVYSHYNKFINKILVRTRTWRAITVWPRRASTFELSSLKVFCAFMLLSHKNTTTFYKHTIF